MLSVVLMACAAFGLSVAHAPKAHAQMGIGALLNPEGSRLFPQNIIVPRHPGKPDLRWRNFDWKFVDSASTEPKYRLYYYTEEDWTARFAMPRIDSEVNYLSSVFNYTPDIRFNYVLFSSQRDFQQANVFDISEGVQGITSTNEATMAVPYWGEAETFRHISTHEMVHQLQYQKVTGLAKDESPEVAFSIMPLWFIEGMAEYYSQHGVEDEARVYLRDIMLYPDPERNYTVPQFFDDFPLDFVHVYKMGQARINFLETRYGKGIVQTLLRVAAQTPMGSPREASPQFRDIVASEVKRKPEQIQKDWEDYLKRAYHDEADGLAQSMDDYDAVKEAGDTLDTYVVSPDGNLIAIREIDPMTGVTDISLLDMKNQGQKTEVIHDHIPSALTLYFFQRPVMALSNNFLVFIAETTQGPELEVRTIGRKAAGALTLGETRRVKLHQHGVVQGSAPAISPDEKRIALVGLNATGWQNLYVLNRSEMGKLRQLTDESYSWHNLSWGPAGILAASDRTENMRYNLFHVDPDTGATERLTHSLQDQDAPQGTSDDLLFQSWQSGSAQLHTMVHGREIRLTEAKTELLQPARRGDTLYALGFKSGRYHLYRIPKDKILNKEVLPEPGVGLKPWRPILAVIPHDEVRAYRPFKTSGIRLDQLGGFFGSGGFGEIAAQVSDLMRNYSVAGQLAVLGNFKYTNASFALSSFSGRTKWVVGLYHLVEARLDNIFQDRTVRTYLNREFGVLGATQYPLTAFSFFDAELRLAGVNRSDFSDSKLVSTWEAKKPGIELLIDPVLRLGHDRVVYERYTGPYKGYGVLLEADTSFYPSRREWNERGRLDAAYYLKLIGRTVLAFQGVGGASLGGPFRDPFMVLSDDIMRAYSFGDDRLRGNYVLAGKSELRFPIGTFLKIPELRGVLAFDYGTIFKNWGDAPGGVASSYSAGLAFNIPPLAINFLFSFPNHLGPGPTQTTPVTHFTLRYLYL